MKARAGKRDTLSDSVIQGLHWGAELHRKITGTGDNR